MRGRPVRSQIRQNVVEIISCLGEAYGYQIAKIYNEIFPEVSQRSVYYHLRKGVQTKEIELHKIEVEKGEFSWGNSVEKIYYALGSSASPRGDDRVKKFMEKANIKIKSPVKKIKVKKGLLERFRGKR